MKLRILAPFAVLSLVAVPAMAASSKAPAKHQVVKHHVKAKTAKTTPKAATKTKASNDDAAQ
jgi:hypothetical protein